MKYLILSGSHWNIHNTNAWKKTVLALTYLTWSPMFTSLLFDLTDLQSLLSNIYPISYGCTVFLHTFTTICLDGNTFWLIGPNLLNNPDCTVWLSFVRTSVFHQPSLIYDLWFCDFFLNIWNNPWVRYSLSGIPKKTFLFCKLFLLILSLLDLILFFLICSLET